MEKFGNLIAKICMIIYKSGLKDYTEILMLKADTSVQKWGQDRAERSNTSWKPPKPPRGQR